ncbi:MAG TPA: uroporphyrinogen decarboxylase [Vicinamibacterales bacterium]|nr:uroporphyrinogen decarboxylase [Vicinamibacterales bacterium]
MHEAPAAARRANAADTARPLFLRACAGEAVERTPIWIMRQAGRYLPEYRAIRERHEFLACCRTPEIACAITLQPVRRLGVDAAILFSDILVPLPGMGVDVRFEPGPRLERSVRSQTDVASLRVPDVQEHMGCVLDAIRLIRRELPPQVPLIGFAGAPFTMAAYLVEGGGSRSFGVLRTMVHSDPAILHRLLRICAETAASYLREQVLAGAQAAMLFDTWAGLLAPRDVREFVIPYARRVFDAVRQAAAAQGEAVPTIYYAGESAGWIEACRDTGADVIGIDWRQGLDTARARLGPDVVLQGNLDPTVLLGPAAQIRLRAREVLEAARVNGQPTRGPRGHVFNLGHGILPETPPDHARLLVEAVRKYSGGAA